MELPHRITSPAIMKDLLGLVFFSLLLMAGTALKCETCFGHGTSCSGEKQTCHPSQDACISSVTELREGKATTITAMKSCSTNAVCAIVKHGVRGWSGTSRSVIKKIQCSKAMVSTGSFLLALSGFLLQKLIL